MMKYHGPRSPVTIPVKFHMSDSPAVHKLKATVLNMVKYDSEQRHNMEQVKEAVSEENGKEKIWFNVTLALTIPSF